MRRVVWFSCGAASAVAASLCPDAEVVYCDTSASEHPDNARFMRDVERWIGRQVVVVGGRFKDVDEVFADRRYMGGIAGAPCTLEMKKLPRMAYQRPDDRHVFGFTADEGGRADRLSANNPELLLDWPLIERGITKAACFAMLAEAGIPLPAMYRLGFNNNNCIGCVKATSPVYWNRVRKHFPEVFAQRAQRSREIGARLARQRGERVFLDELDPESQESFADALSCGPECGTSDKETTP